MSLIKSSYLSALEDATWYESSAFNYPDDYVKSWISEQGSLTKKLRSCCQDFEVMVDKNQKVHSDSISPGDRKGLPFEASYLLRQVMLYGDTKPWVWGSTIIPYSTMINQKNDLSKLGNSPLGDAVFDAEYTFRDALEVSILEMDNTEPLYARRSRLWMNKKPMLVTELFLPDSPLYAVGELK